MSASVRILLGTIAAFVLIALGFALGLFVYEGNKNAPSAQVTKADIKSQNPPNHHTYDISPPSRGLMLELQPVDIQPQGAVGIAKLSSTENVKTGQKVFLYNANGDLLMSMGEVVSIEQSSADTLTVQINLESNPDVAPDAVVKGNIIVNRQKDVARLPYSALVKGKDGTLYIWEVERSREGIRTGHYKKANVTGGNDLFFVIGQEAGGSNLFILHPDDRLVDGDIINTRDAYYDAPSQSEDEKVESVTERRRVSAFAAREAQNMIYNKRGGAAPSAAGSPSCGQTPNATGNFIAKIRAMARKPAGAGTAPPSCPQAVSCYNGSGPSP